MREFQTKNRFRRWLYSYPSLIIVAIIAGLMARGAIKMAQRERGSQLVVEDLQSQAAALTNREYELKDRLAQLKNEDGVYAELRERFNVKAEGEEMFIIVDPKHPKVEVDHTKSPWYERWWGAIIGR